MPLDLHRVRPATLAVTLALGVATLATGCRRSLFAAGTARNQFETYDRLRGREAPLEEPDVFGNPQPALRARLSRP